MRALPTLLLLLVPAQAADAPLRGEQVVLVYDHREANGMDVVVPKGTIVLGLRPLDGSAPMSAGSLMVCRPYRETIVLFLRPKDRALGPDVRPLDGDKMEVTEVAFDCGGKRYLVAVLSFQSPK